MSIKKVGANCWAKSKGKTSGSQEEERNAGMEEAFGQTLEREACNNHVISWVAGKSSLCHPRMAKIG